MADKNKFIVSNQPLYDYLSIFYNHGLYAVELFFVISGFIFFYLYYDNIQNKSITLKAFFVKRLSRLYPLYFISFILVAFLQALFFETHNSYFVYYMNDIYHAILNILMIQSWGLERGWSYNAPTWSVSIEVLMYSMFFIFCLFKQKNSITLIVIVLTAFFLYDINNGVMIGVFCFFLGGLSYNITQYLISKIGSTSYFRATLIFSLLSWLFISILHIENIFIIVSLGFAPTICTLASLNALKQNLGEKIEWVGDISYSSYLLHFPLQIVFVLFSDLNGYNRDIFNSTYVMLIFFTLLITISYFSYKLIEIPAQRKIRDAFLRAN